MLHSDYRLVRLRARRERKNKRRAHKSNAEIFHDHPSIKLDAYHSKTLEKKCQLFGEWRNLTTFHRIFESTFKAVKFYIGGESLPLGFQVKSLRKCPLQTVSFSPLCCLVRLPLLRGLIAPKPPHGDGSFFRDKPAQTKYVDFRHITMYGLLALSKW